MKCALVLASAAWMAASAMSLSGQAADAADWKAWLEGRAAAFSGVALVARGDTIQAVVASGVADRRTGRAIDAGTRFNLGSINKTFTALAIAQLVQQGRVSLDARLSIYLPDYPNREAAARITIRDLISHRSGVATFMRAEFGEASVAEMTRIVGAEPQVFEPGARQEYSNGGYIVLGRVVEVVSGTSYAEYVARHIYGPAGMTDTGFAIAGRSDATMARGYFPADAQGRPMRGAPGGSLGSNPLAPGNPAGGGYATAADLFRFARALKDGRLLDARTTDLVVRGSFAGESGAAFGFALREQTVGARRFVGNGGGAPGVNAEFRFEPAGDATVVVLANASPPAATEMLTAILTRLASSRAADQ